MIVADANTGLRAWSLKGDERLVASIPLRTSKPASLAIDDTESPSADLDISVGFEDGSFGIYRLVRAKRKIDLKYRYPTSCNGSIHAIAYASPYILTMTGEPLLSLYRFDSNVGSGNDQSRAAPILLSSLRSRTAYPPTALALRVSATTIVASIAYAVPTWTMGWSVGLQELRLTKAGEIMESRMAAAPSHSMLGQRLSSGASNVRETGSGRSPLPKPTSISYNHPYLLSAHADNTLTLHMVTSTVDELRVGRGNRLWGHTSSVSGAHVGDRGKAVSVSAHGNELRVWELEGGLSSSALRRRAAAGEASVQVRSAELSAEASLTNANTLRAISTLGQRQTDKTVSKGWIAFDEEKVVLLREKLKGAQALVVYDFS